MIAKRLTQNGAIGIFCPSHIADSDTYSRIAKTISTLGFKVKLGANIYKNTWGFVASAKERAADLNALVNDDDVQMILFGGGECAAEILPLIDYDNIKKHPKIFSSYSDGTSVLNAIYAQTGLITYYGIGTGEFLDLNDYDRAQFCSHFADGYESDEFIKDSSWVTICPGSCSGVLIGGYLPYFGMMLANRYFRFDKNSRYILFIEDHEKFSSVGAVNSYLSFIEQSEFMKTVTGVIFGHYSDEVPADLLHFLERFGKRNNIPAVYTGDFGHAARHAVLPIGMHGKLNANEQSLIYCAADI